MIASERPTCCLIRNLAGTYDTGYIQQADGLRVLADLKTLSRPGSGSYCTRAQLGGYMALEATWGVHYEAGQTIWARPGRPASRRCIPARNAWLPGQRRGRAT